MGGYDYQIWTSIESWLLLGADEVLYLEGAEDIDKVGPAASTATQVRRTTDTISLNVEVARTAIKNYWKTVEEAPGRVVRYVYMTTSRTATEQNAAFDGLKGIEAWRKAALDADVAELVRKYLVEHLGATGALQALLAAAPIADVQAKLFSRFTWLTDQPPVDVVKASVTERLEQWCDGQGLSRLVAAKVRQALLECCWERALKPELADRRLDGPLLASTREGATSVDLKLSLATAQGLMQFAVQLPSLQHQLASLGLLLREVPSPPSQIVERPTLIGQLKRHLNQREPVFLSGAAYKGKTTLALVVAHQAGPSARWVDLSGREPAAIADIFNAVRPLLDAVDGPALVVFDDLDTNAKSRKAYAPALRQLLHRAKLAGTALLFTAQGQSEALTEDVANQWGLSMLDVPPLTEEEIQALCIALGCPSASLASSHARLIATQSTGQPRLAQVRAQELASQNWPQLSIDLVTGKSPALRTAMQAARELFEASVTPQEAAFVYEAAEFLHPSSRAMLLRLADLPTPLVGAASVLDRLHGRWFEGAAEGRCRVTPILKGELNVTWTPAQYQAVQGKLFDAIEGSGPFTPTDGAAMMFHAFFSLDRQRIARAARIIITAERLAAEQIHARLGWIAHVAVAPDRAVPGFGLEFRAVQFRTAAQESPEAIPAVIAAWRRDIDADAADPAAQARARLLVNLSILDNGVQIPIAVILEAAADLHRTVPRLDAEAKAMLDQHAADAVDDDIPAGSTMAQVMLARRAGTVRSMEDLKAIFAWVDQEDDEALLGEFDAVVSWPASRNVGAFVHWAWATEIRASDPDLPGLVAALDEGLAIMVRKRMTALGGELGRAKSITLSEYVRDFEEAQKALIEAQAAFGDSAVLSEQWVNLHYHAKDYAKADQAWHDLVAKFGVDATQDPFAFRRAAVSAAQIGDLERASEIFEAGSVLMPGAMPVPLKLGLLGDAAHCAWQAGDKRRASSLLAAAALQVPEAARGPGDLKLLLAVAQLKLIAQMLTPGPVRAAEPAVPYQFGQASNPGTRAVEGPKDPALAVKLLEARAGLLEGQWEDASKPMMDRIAALCADVHPVVQMTAAQARMGWGLSGGPEVEFVEGLAAFMSVYEALAALKGQTEVQRYAVCGSFVILGLCCSGDPARTASAWKASAAVPADATLGQLISEFNAGFAATDQRVGDLVFGQVKGKAMEVVGSMVKILHSHCDENVLAKVQTDLMPILRKALQGLNLTAMDFPLVRQWAAQWEIQHHRVDRFRQSPSDAARLRELLDRARQDEVSLEDFVLVTGQLVGLHDGEAVAGPRPAVTAATDSPAGEGKP